VCVDHWVQGSAPAASRGGVTKILAIAPYFLIR